MKFKIGDKLTFIDDVCKLALIFNETYISMKADVLAGQVCTITDCGCDDYYNIYEGDGFLYSKDCFQEFTEPGPDNTTEVTSFDRSDDSRQHRCDTCGQLWTSYGPPNYCPGCGRKVIK